MTGSLSMTRRPGRTTLYFVFALVLLTACAGFALQRHLIARSVLEHPVIGAVTALAEEEGWSAVADRIVRPGPVEPLWLAGMIDPPYRRELVFAAPGASAERLGPAVARALFGAEGGPPNEPHDGVYWRTSGVTSTLT